jgi:hypothetical protein
MARDKAKDDEYFNCDQEHEFTYVANLYADHDKVYNFLKDQCGKKINYSTHAEVYQLIKDELGYPVPS